MDRYTILKTIGRGNFGVVHLCQKNEKIQDKMRNENQNDNNNKNENHNSNDTEKSKNKLYVVKQIQMTELSKEEKEQAAQEVNKSKHT